MPSRVLVIDAMSNRRIQLQAQLVGGGFDVELADTGLAGLSRVRSAVPDAVIFDWGIRDIAAEKLVSCLRNRPETRDFPVIACVGKDDHAARLAAMENGAADVVEQGVAPAELRARLRKLLRHRQSMKTLRLRTETHRTLGLSEAAPGFEAAVNVRVVSCGEDAVATCVADALGADRGHVVSCDLPRSVRRQVDTSADVYVVIEAGSPATGDDLVSCLRAWPATTRPAILYMADPGCREAAASPLDLGADDLVSTAVQPRELALRVDRLARRKRLTDRLKADVLKLEHSAFRDSVTGLNNQNFATEYLRKLDRQVSENPRNLALIIADLDHFKRVNDTYGHPTGDAVLAHVARLMQSRLRDADMIARFGGEEFLIVLHDVHLREARVVADRLRDCVATTPFALPGGKTVLATVSMGIAFANRSERRSMSRLRAAADSALYRAKRNGRDRVSVANGDDYLATANGSAPIQFPAGLRRLRTRSDNLATPSSSRSA